MMNGFGWGGWLSGVVTPTVQDILGERLARGGIDADEYARRRDALARTEATHV